MKFRRFFSQLLIIAMLAAHMPDANAIMKPTPPKPVPVPLPKPRLPEADAKPANPASPGWGVADPIAACPADVTRKEVALCEPAVPTRCSGDFSKERREGGIGKEIQTWPPYSDKDDKYAQKLRKFQEEKADHYLNQLNSSHKALDGKPYNLKPSIRARTLFFQAEFDIDVLKDGSHLNMLAGVVPTCERQRELGKYISNYFKAKEKLAGISGTSANACSGAYQQMYDNFKLGQAKYEEMAKRLDGIIEGGLEKKEADGSKKIFMGFEKMFKFQSTANDKNILEAKNTALAPELYQKLRDEYEHLWVYKPDSNKTRSTNGMYAQFISQLKAERELAKKKGEFFKKHAKDYEDLKKRCGSLTPPAAANPHATVPPKPSDISGGSRPHGGPAPAPTTVAPPTRDGERDQPRERDTSRETTPKVETVTVTDTNTNTDTKPTPPTPPAAPNAGGTFLKDNWMWLAGGGVLAVGGYFAYKEYKKRKDEKDYWSDPSHYAVATASTSPTATSTTISIAQGGQVPAGTKIIIVTPPAAPAVAATMSTIDVVLVNADGIVQAIDGLAIEASCLAPNPCSLTGGKSVTTTQGRASFSALSFSQPDQGVVMQFSGPGLQSVTSQGTFNVSGTVLRQ